VQFVPCGPEYLDVCKHPVRFVALRWSQQFCESPHWKKVLSNLVSRNLLLHRRHNDEVSVWHGTDLDLRGRLEEERHRVADDFDLVSFLAKEAKPPAWKPVEYNDDFGVRRYLRDNIKMWIS